MIIKKKYVCEKCDHVFYKDISDKYVQTSIPKCPICESTKIRIVDKK